MILEYRIVEGICRPMSHLNSSTAWGDTWGEQNNPVAKK